MTLIFEDETREILSFDKEQIAYQVMEAALDYVNCPYEAQINLLLVDNQEIARMNREFRRIDEPTDVLSFPALEYEQAGSFDFLKEEVDFFDPESGELLLGDIMISMERAKAQAAAYGHSLLREYAFLIAHSMLHLCGFDHMEESERKQMEAMQEEILQKIGITRQANDKWRQWTGSDVFDDH